MKFLTVKNRVCVLLAAALLVSACGQICYEEPGPYSADKINRTIEQIRHVRTKREEYYLSLLLVDTAVLTDGSKIDDKTIDNLASLLTIPYKPIKADPEIALILKAPKNSTLIVEKASGAIRMHKGSHNNTLITENTLGIIQPGIDDDALRVYTAMALGEIGPKARRSIPTLERALGEIRAIEKRYVHRLTTDSSDSICTAFYKIGGEEELAKHDCKTAIIIGRKNQK